MIYAGLHGRVIGFVHGLWLQIAPAVPMSALELLDTGLPDIAGCLQRPPKHTRNSTCQKSRLLCKARLHEFTFAGKQMVMAGNMKCNTSVIGAK